MEVMSWWSAENLVEFRTEEFSITAWAPSTALIMGESVLAPTLLAPASEATSPNNQSIANGFWGFVKLSVTGEPPMQVLSCEHMGWDAELIAQEMANLSWQMATAMRQGPPTVDTASVEQSKKAGQSATQNPSNAVWRLATVGMGNPEPTDALAEDPGQNDPGELDQDFSIDEVSGALDEQGFGLLAPVVHRDGQGRVEVARTIAEAFSPVEEGDGAISGVLMKSGRSYFACTRNGDVIHWVDVLVASKHGHLADDEFVEHLQSQTCFRIFRRRT